MKTRSNARWLIALQLTLAGAGIFAACGGDGDDTSSSSTTGTGSGAGTATGTTATSTGTGDVVVTALAVDPPSAPLTVDQTTPATQAFKAIGTLGDGTSVEVAATWSVDNPAPGSIDPSTGLYTTGNGAGGKVVVTASYGGKTATADLTVIFAPKVDDGDVPPGTPDLFDPSQNTPLDADPLSPDIAYPSDGTMFPTNIYRILFQWRAQGMSVFHLHFVGDYIDLDVYTDGANPTCVAAANDAGCWEATQQVWSWMASSAAGGKIKLTVEAADPATPGIYYVGDSIDVLFSKNPVPGAIYYWSTTQAGVMRAAVSDSAPAPFMTPTEVGQCVACHTLSRNGKKMGADVGGEKLWVVAVDGNVPPPVVFDKSNGQDIPNAWSTFDYDATRVVSASKGVLKLLDGDTGAPIGGAGNGVIDLGAMHGTQPDWAPDGLHLAFTYGSSTADRGVQGSSIAMLDHAADAFSNLQVIRQSAASDDTYGYPMFDPTSQWIAYMHATGKSDKNPLAKLYVAKAQAGAPEFDLEKANTVVSDTVVPSGVANHMPTWAPQPVAGDVMWIAFASRRDYGLVLTPGSAIGDDKQQLWVAAIDPAKLGAGDPSFPAFRLPFQLLSEDNHRPFWAEDALDIPDGGVPDAGGDAACKLLTEDCSTGPCCEGTVCEPNADGTAYVCVVAPPA